MSDSKYVIRRSSIPGGLWKDRKPRLKTLDVELTERCNNNCIHCNINLPRGDPDARSREMVTETLSKILTEAADLGCLKVRFTGGEPLIRPDFAELYHYARKLGLRVLIFTNATLITPELADLWGEIPPLERIEVTIYGMSARSCDAVTGIKGSYRAMMHGINLLLERNVPFAPKWVSLPQNAAEEDDYSAWAASIPGMNDTPLKTVVLDLRGRRDSEVKNSLINKLRWSPEEVIRRYNLDDGDAVSEAYAFCQRFAGARGDRLFTCGAGEGTGCVDAYGNFQLCMLLRHPETVYDLSKGSLEDALMNFFPEVRRKTATDPDYMRHCARCLLKGLCDQCPAKSWMEHGTLDTPVEYLCRIAHIYAERIGLLAEGEKGWEVENQRERLKVKPILTHRRGIITKRK